MISKICLMSLLICLSLQEVLVAESPNILFILADDLPWSGTNVAMHPELPETSRNAFVDTPAIAKLAKHGIRFSDAYAPAPICTPTRRSVLCGMTVARQRGAEFRSLFDPSKHLTIPRALKQANPEYVTAHFGKWGEAMVASPEQAGYDVSDGETGNVTGESDDPTDPKLTESLSRRAADFIRESAVREKPFYVQVSYYAVHMSIQARPENIKKYRDRRRPTRSAPHDFYAMLEELDRGVAMLLSALDEVGVSDRTWVFFSSDNGGREFEKLSPRYLEALRQPKSDYARQSQRNRSELARELSYRLPDNSPLRGSKQTLFEGGIRVQLIVRGPGVRAGTFQRQPVALYDLLPTFYELAGGDEPLPSDIDGRSILPDLRGERLPDAERVTPGLVFHRPRPHGSTKQGYSALRHRNYKLIVQWNPDGEVAGTELFRLDRDIREAYDLSREDPERHDRLLAKLLGYLEHVNAERPQETPGSPSP